MKSTAIHTECSMRPFQIDFRTQKSQATAVLMIVLNYLTLVPVSPAIFFGMRFVIRVDTSSHLIGQCNLVEIRCIRQGRRIQSYLFCTVVPSARSIFR